MDEQLAIRFMAMVHTMLFYLDEALCYADLCVRASLIRYSQYLYRTTVGQIHIFEEKVVHRLLSDRVVFVGQRLPQCHSRLNTLPSVPDVCLSEEIQSSGAR